MRTMHNAALTVAGMVAVAALVWFVMWLVWPFGGQRASERIWRRLAHRIAVVGVERSEEQTMSLAWILVGDADNR